ncbi:ParE family toxin-like protein [Serratia liquefaciens]|uniref:ParE family toxin-like protein n=1 Tax=Serratia liquefaciens TaxID=614 RepID=UPI0009006C04|nr:hypothetical protein [Serratia liquefaciens]AUW40050.1 hypothetical protein AL485_25220 [Serratia liquefaciens]
MKPRIPENISAKAEVVLCAYRAGQAKPRRTYQHKYLTLPVTPWWRYLSKDDGTTWRLMSHETYNGEIKK